MRFPGAVSMAGGRLTLETIQKAAVAIVSAMTSNALLTSVAPSTPSDQLDDAELVARIAHDHADITELQRSLAGPVAEALVESELFALAAPTELGGAAAHPAAPRRRHRHRRRRRSVGGLVPGHRQRCQPPHRPLPRGGRRRAVHRSRPSVVCVVRPGRRRRTGGRWLPPHWPLVVHERLPSIDQPHRRVPRRRRPRRAGDGTRRSD